MITRNATLPEPELIAQRLLARVEFARPPIDLGNVIAIWKNLDLVEEELDGSGYLLPLGDVGAEIVVNKCDPPERQRFTIAHELGHWVLGLIWLKKSGRFQQPPISRAYVEKWCDSFATNLLMPSEMVKHSVSELHQPTLMDKLLRARQLFGVSEQAFFIRVWELSKVQVVTLKPKGGMSMEFEVEADSAGGANKKKLLDLLSSPEICAQMRLSSPMIFFSGTGRGSSFYCSGKRISSDRIILAIDWGN